MVNSNYFYVDYRQVKSLRISWPPPPILSFLSFLLQSLVIIHVHRVQINTNFGPSFTKITIKNDFGGGIQNLHSIVSLLACLIVCRNFLYSFFFFPFVFFCLFLCYAKGTSSSRPSNLVLGNQERVKNQL